MKKPPTSNKFTGFLCFWTQVGQLRMFDEVLYSNTLARRQDHHSLKVGRHQRASLPTIATSMPSFCLLTTCRCIISQYWLCRGQKKWDCRIWTYRYLYTYHLAFGATVLRFESPPGACSATVLCLRLIIDLSTATRCSLLAVRL